MPRGTGQFHLLPAKSHLGKILGGVQVGKASGHQRLRGAPDSHWQNKLHSWPPSHLAALLVQLSRPVQRGVTGEEGRKVTCPRSRGTSSSQSRACSLLPGPLLSTLGRASRGAGLGSGFAASQEVWVWHGRVGGGCSPHLAPHFGGGGPSLPSPPLCPRQGVTGLGSRFSWFAEESEGGGGGGRQHQPS